MTTYRFLWLSVSILSLAPGLAVSLTWPTGSVLALFPVCAFLIGVAKIHYNLLTIDAAAPSPLRAVMRNVPGYAFVGAIVMVAFTGLSALMGAWVLLVSVLLASSSPAAIRFYRRRFAGVGVDADHRPGSDDLPPKEYPLTAVEREARGLTDMELCQVWRASCLALQAATATTLRAKIVATRHVYLDEFARRNAAGLNAWISSGADGLDDPTPMFCSSTGHSETPIDWDAVMFGQDDS